MPTESAFSEIKKLLTHPVSVVGVLTVTILTTVLMLIFEATQVAAVADQRSIGLVGIIIHGLLTVFLLTIYTEMRTMQEEQRNTEQAQKELQEEIVDLQRSLTSMESEPQVVMEQLRVSNSKDKDLTLTLSNVGRGFAKNLKVAIDVEIYRGTEVDVEFETYKEVLERRRNDENLVGGGNYLMPNEDNVEFEFSSFVKIVYRDLGPDNPTYPTYKVNQIPEALLTQDLHSGKITPEDLGYQSEGLREGFWTIKDAINCYDIQLVVMKLSIIYEIVAGEKRTEGLTDYIVPVCEAFSTEDALNNGITREEYEWGLNNKGDFFSTLEGYNRSLALKKGPAETHTPLDV